jgi:hypothetical protein
MPKSGPQDVSQNWGILKRHQIQDTHSYSKESHGVRMVPNLERYPYSASNKRFLRLTFIYQLYVPWESLRSYLQSWKRGTFGNLSYTRSTQSPLHCLLFVRFLFGNVLLLPRLSIPRIDPQLTEWTQTKRCEETQSTKTIKSTVIIELRTGS